MFPPHLEVTREATAGAGSPLWADWLPGQVLRARVSEVLGEALYKIAIGTLSIEVKSGVPLARGDALRLVVERAGESPILRLVPEESNRPRVPSGGTPAPVETSRAPAGPLEAFFRAEGLPIEPELVALAERFATYAREAPGASTPALRTAAYLLARGIVPEGEAARGLAQLVAGHPGTPLPEPGATDALRGLASRPEFAALREFLEAARSGVSTDATSFLGRVQLGRARLVAGAREEIVQSLLRHFRSRPELAALDEAIRRLDEPPTSRHQPSATPPRGAAGSHEESLRQFLRAVEHDRDGPAAYRVFEREIARLDVGERFRWREALATLENRILAEDPAIRELRDAYRVIQPEFARVDGARLLRLLESGRGDLVYAGALPFGDAQEGRIHVYRRRSGGGQTGAKETGFTLYLDLVTNSLGRVTGWIRLLEKTLSIRFDVEREETRDTLRELASSLEGELAGMGFVPSIGVELEEKPRDPRGDLVDFESPIAAAGARRIDLWG